MSNLRQFGLELECFNPRVAYSRSGQNIQNAIAAMGYPAIATNRHFDTQYDKWQIKPDATVAPQQNGLEVVSRTLPGTEASLDEVKKVATWLGNNGYDVDRTCGYHIHIDAADMTSYEAAAVAWRYTARIDDFKAILPASRHNTRWGGPLVGSALSKVARVIETRNPSESWGMSERYAAVNLQHVAKDRAARRIEFRQHSGTLNPGKIIGWYRLLCDFIAETLRILRWPTTSTAAAALTPATAGPVRRQRPRPAVATVSRVVGEAAPGIPNIEAGSDYDMFLNRLTERGVITQNDARGFGWPDTRLRVTAHWLRRNGAALTTTERNGELAYVGENGARQRADIFTRPAQIRERVSVSGAATTTGTTRIPLDNTVPHGFGATPAATIFQRLAAADVLQGASDDTKSWFRGRVEDFRNN